MFKSRSSEEPGCKSQIKYRHNVVFFGVCWTSSTRKFDKYSNLLEINDFNVTLIYHGWGVKAMMRPWSTEMATLFSIFSKTDSVE